MNDQNNNNFNNQNLNNNLGTNYTNQPINNTNNTTPNQDYNYNQNTNYPNQPHMMNNEIPNKKNNNQLFVIIIIIAIIVVVGVTLGIVFTSNNDKNENNHKNINEYEEIINDTKDTPSEEINNQEKVDTQIYKGFTFNKMTGYTYKVEDNILTIASSNIGIMLNVLQQSFIELKANYTTVPPALKPYLIGQPKLNTYSNVEVITYELNNDGANMLYFVLSAPADNYMFEGYVINKQNVHNYSNINEVIKIVSNAKYSGNTQNYSTNFGVDIELKNIIE